MKSYITNIEKFSLENDNFRKVLYTDKNSQLVLMSLLPGEEIGAEVHSNSLRTTSKSMQLLPAASIHLAPEPVRPKRRRLK